MMVSMFGGKMDVAKLLSNCCYTERDDSRTRGGYWMWWTVVVVVVVVWCYGDVLVLRCCLRCWFGGLVTGVFKRVWNLEDGQQVTTGDDGKVLLEGSSGKWMLGMSVCEVQEGVAGCSVVLDTIVVLWLCWAFSVVLLYFSLFYSDTSPSHSCLIQFRVSDRHECFFCSLRLLHQAQFLTNTPQPPLLPLLP